MVAGRVTRGSIRGAVSAHLDAGRSVLLVGEPGVGKTHLLREIAAARTDDYVAGLIGSPAIRSIPFGAVAHFVPSQAVSDPLRLLQLTRRALEESAGDQTLFLTIDDLDQIDHGSQALVHQLAASRGATILATVRQEHVASDEIAAFWKDEHLTRFDLAPLTRPEQDQLVEELIGSPVPHTAANRLWQLTQGNPLFAREVVLVVGEAGFARPDELHEAMPESARLRDYANDRLAGMSDNERAIIESLALSEPLDAGVADRLFDASSLAALQQRFLVVVERLHDARVYRIAHPLLAELVRTRLSADFRRERISKLAAMTLKSGTPGPTTDLRVTTWLLDAELPVDPDLALRAALAAQHVFDGAAALRASTAAMSAGPTLDRLIAHGTSLSLVGQLEQADQALTAAEAMTDDEAQLGALTVMRCINLIHQAGHFEKAIELLRRRENELSTPSARANIGSMLMQADGVQGDFRRTFRDGPELAAAARGDGIAELRVLATLVVARVVTGHLETAPVELDRGLTLARGLANQHPIEADQMMLNEMLHELTRPDIHRSLQLVEERLADTSGAGEGPWFVLATWALSAAGSLEQATRVAEAGLERLAQVDPLGMQVVGAGANAMANAQAGHLEAADASLQAAISDPRSAIPRSQMMLSRARAWLNAHREGTEVGARIAVRQGQFLHDAWHQTWGAWTAFDAVRFGHADLAITYLERAASESADGAVRLFAQHARACVDGDLGALSAIATRWADCGALAHAAEAHAHAALVAKVPEDKARQRQRALLLLDSCPGLRSPVLDAIESPLSDRELEVARRASAGESSREIAGKLFLSPRTVDNHLGSIYARLGMTGRSDLATVFERTHLPIDQYQIAI